MSIKKLFDSNKSSDILISTNLEEEIVKNAPELESADNVREQIERINRFIPQIDFEDPHNFVQYGSAQSYYEDAISRIYNKFPYDGSQEEITAFHNESTYLDIYVFDNKYPRTTGYAVLSSDNNAAATRLAKGKFSDGPVKYSVWSVKDTSADYIKILGGPHAVEGGMVTGSFHTQFTASNYYDTDIYTSDGTLALDRVGTRESNLKFSLSNGVTTEFWLNVNSDWPQSSHTPSRPQAQIIYDQWNGAASSSADYGRLLIYLSGSGDDQNPIQVHLASGSNVWDMEFGGSTTLTSSLTDTWNHIALTFVTGASQFDASFYLNGKLQQTNTNTSIETFGEITGSLIGYIGTLATTVSGSPRISDDGTMGPGSNAYSGSIDEFRYWKTKRTEKDIQHNWWTQVRGGTNNEVANAELGVYYKFNEGIVGTSSIDSVALDYSGRISNGAWTNYPGSSARNVGSAIVSSSAVVSGTVEYKDPIIYSTHPDVVSLYNELSATGSVFDYENQASIIDSIPGWIIDQEEAEGSGDLKKLTQIIGSYLDTLHLQVEALPTLIDNTYLSSSNKPTPFMKNLLSSRGLAVPEIFVDADLLERFANRRSDRKYELDLHDVKNLIYKNIYNNLIYLYKSKGTEKAFRNLIRCYGIGDEIVKFNAYGNNTTFKFEDTDYASTVRKNFVDFNHPDRFTGVVYQNSSSTNAETTGITHISGTNKYFANTAEIEVVFPKKLEFVDSAYFDTPFVSSSVFGYHHAAADPNDHGWPALAANDKSVQLYAVKTSLNSPHVYFHLKSPAGSFNLTSSAYSNVYDNQKWNFAVRFKHKKWPYANGLTGSSTSDKVVLEWYGVNVEHGIIKNNFLLTASSLDDEFLQDERRYYVGASRTDNTSSVLVKSDVRVSSLRHWATYLEDSVIIQHAKDSDNVGTLHPSRNAVFMGNSAGSDADNTTLLNASALALHWDFSQVTGSDSSGIFTVEDAASGSTSLQGRYNNDGNISHIIANQYSGRGYFPNSVSSTNMISKEYLSDRKQRLPEVLSMDDAVNVLSRDDELFPRDPAVSQMFFAFEKSMYGVISQEMVNMFGTITEFNNLIGEVTHKYRDDYKGLRLLREMFFEKIQNDPDLDKFIDFYKWIDASLIIFLQQFVPASADVSEDIRVMVEDHILERSKYRHQYPMLDYKGNERWGADDSGGGTKLEARVKGINELTYNWQYGHAPIRHVHLDSDQTTGARWWKERSERSNPGFNVATSIDSARQSINDIILSFNSASAEKFNTGAGPTGVYEGSTYAIRRFTNSLRTTINISTQIGGGYNYPRGQKPDALFSIIKRGSTTDRYDATKGSFKDINIAEAGPPIIQTKRKFPAQLITENLDSNSYATNKFGLPAVVYSSSAGSTGYRSATSGDEYAGLHNDSYGDDYDVPMQGPFPQEHVGGHRHRHVDITIDPTLTSSVNRPEAWHLNNGRFRSNDSTFVQPSTSPQYRRDQIAKRPFNIKNIQHTTASVKLGNFNKRYEVVQTSDRRTNNSEFVKSEGFSTASITTDLLGYVGGLVDYAKPTRTRREHVIVERFSAPGGPEVAGDTIGGAGLDYESGQYSPYNNLNYRNTTVRQPLQTLLTERSERFGLRSGSAVSVADYTGVTASYHKIHRNSLIRLESGSTDANPVVSASVHDNYYVRHMIPRSDFQYSWITASTDRFDAELGAANNIIGYFPYDGLARVSSSVGYSYVSAVNFASASENGSGYSSGGDRIIQQKDDSYLAGTFVPNNYVGMNTNIIDKIRPNQYTVGFPLTKDVKNYINHGDIGDAAVGANPNSFIQNMTDNVATRAATFNGIIHYRGGPYGYSTWKQIRIGQGQLARHYRKNNVYTHTPDRGDVVTVEVPDGTKTIRQSNGTTISATQSVVTQRYYPIVYELEVRTGETNGRILRTSDIVVKTSFVNDIFLFDDNDFAKELVSPQKVHRAMSRTSYKQIIDDYNIHESFLDEDSPIVQIKKLKYRETVYPSAKYSHTEKIRGRTNYENNFWRDLRADRTTKAASKKITNSAGWSVNQSAWALDAGELFATNEQAKNAGEAFLAATGGIVANDATGYSPGELQNKYTHFVQQEPLGSSFTVRSALRRPGALYARKHIFPFSSSVSRIHDMKEKISVTVGASNAQMLPTASIGSGEAHWDTPTLAGRYKGTSSIFVSASVNPFYDSYDEYFADVKPKGKSYSIIPEFRISEHLDFYDLSGGNFLEENSKFLTIAGVPTESRLPQNSAEDDFFTIFTNSDFMKYFEVVARDGKKQGGILEPSEIKLRCKAIKKFIPYDGFYPAERSLQLATQFSKSFGPDVNTVGTDAPSSGDGHRALHTLMKPFFSPGIFYNTIKSGMAVDYPIMTGSITTHRQYKYTGSADGDVGNRYKVTASYAIGSNSRYYSRNNTTALEQFTNPGRTHNDGWDYRVPFEALVEPTKYIYGKSIVNDEPTDFAGMDITASWGSVFASSNKNYTNMMHNFLAETTNFFMKNGRPTTFKSLPEEEFEAMTAGQPYGMRIKIYRSLETGSVNPPTGSWGSYPIPQYISGSSKTNFTMYSRPSAFGPPVATVEIADADDSVKLAGVSTYGITGSHEFSPANGVYASHTPPYYDGEAWIDIIYYPYRSFASASVAGNVIFSYDNTDPVKPTVDDLHTLSLIPSITPGVSIGGLSEDGVHDARIGAGGTYVRYWRFDQEALTRDSTAGPKEKIPNSTYHDISARSGPMAGPWANIWSMQGDSSLNIFEKFVDKKGRSRWKIQTKFETPMLNFNYLADADITKSTATVTAGAVNNTIPRGMWHQFGRLPRGDEGVYIQLSDIPDEWLTNQPSSSVIFDPGGHFDRRNAFSQTAANTETAGIPSALSGYRLPQNMVGDLGNDQNNAPVTERPKSLVDICGFSTDPKRVGELRYRKKVFEAVVAVPFIEVNGERRFFNIPTPNTTLYKADGDDKMAGKSIKRLEKMLKKYVFPPSFDFVHNNPEHGIIDVPAVAMYVFEFSHKFTRNDLSHIWQNLPPKLGTNPQAAMTWVRHPLLVNELLGWDGEVSIDYALAKGRDIPKKIDLRLKEFPEKLQWMVFKVKQRAKTDYFQSIGRTVEKKTTTTLTGPDTPDIVETTEVPLVSDVPFYTYNWPYDFFSLVELAEIDAEVTFQPTKRAIRTRNKKRAAAEEALKERTKQRKKRLLDITPEEDER
jgi:hypothetical protein